MIKKITVLLFVAALISGISCSNNSTTSADRGEASFQISGAVDGEKEGYANFRAFEMAGVYTWDILINDGQPRSFEISISAVSGGSLTRPPTGTYRLGVTSDADYAAAYSEGSLAKPTTYTSASGKNTGTMVIAHSTDDEISGTFEFTAINSGRQITISNGQFRAVLRVGGIVKN